MKDLSTKTERIIVRTVHKWRQGATQWFALGQKKEYLREYGWHDLIVQKCNGKMSGKMLQVLISSIPALTIFLQFYTMLGGTTFIKNMLLLFPKKIYFRWNRQFWDQFGAKIMCSYNSGSSLKIFLKFFKIKETKRYMKVELMVFLRKKILGANEPFWA